MRIRFKHILILLLAIGIFALGYLIRYQKTHIFVPFDFNTNLNNILVLLPSEETKFERDLENAFNVAFTQSNPNENSFVMVNATAKNSKSDIDLELLKNNPDFQKEFYIASTYKPFVITAIVKMLDIQNLDFEIPFKFQKQELRMREMAAVLFDYVNYDRIADPIIYKYFSEDFKGSDLSKDEIYEELMSNSKYKEYKFDLKTLIQETLGPSSNWTILLLRDYLALNGYDNDKKAATAIENYINAYLEANDISPDFRLLFSTKAEKDKKYNSMRFYQLEFLFDSLYKNSFEIPAPIHKEMMESMKQIADDPTESNRRHEIKSILKLNNLSAKVQEKSGYIGFDLNATPGLDKVNGWSTMPVIKDKRLIIFNVSTYARIQLNNGQYLDVIYAIASPTYLGLDPYYEELNGEYLEYKNTFLDNLEKHVGKVLSKYSPLLQ